MSNARPALDEHASASFRSTLGNFCSGVTVVTALGDDGLFGFTCQAFSSLSLDPPQVVLCVSRASTTWPTISRLRRFCINVLGEDQQQLSDRFARSGTDKFAGVGWNYSPGGNPLLAGASAWIECEINTEYPGGDHLIVVADVRWLDAGPAERPLVYHRGRYTALRDSASI
ncbi:flavin reductase family protein [Streptomyces cyaneofuscatus]|uniref:flavin reductase family protein n=1 Tax=Streptomyces cyaneofuscatus TaxID=66883 RepID=UPI003813382D